MNQSSESSCTQNPTVCAQLGVNFSCDQSRGCCVEAALGQCSTAADCQQNTLASCDVASQTCRACSTDPQCAAWVAARQDPQNETKCISGQCLECRTNADCTRPGKTTCNQVTNVCAGCTKNSDCPASNICKTDASLLATGDSLSNIGECALAADVVYVDRTNASCATGDGTQAKPLCEISSAIATGKTYILVVKGQGSTALYQPVNVATSGRRVVIMGPGRDVAYSGQAVINGITVSGGAQVTLVDIAAANNAALPAVQCSGSSTLYVHRVLITDTTAVPRGGIYATGCTKVEVEQTKINCVNGNGIFISGGTAHRVINNAIINGLKNLAAPTEQYPLRLSQGADGLFSFNTIASNLNGVLCDTAATVSDSVVVGNATGTQVAGCSASSLRNAVMNVDLQAGYMMGGDPDLVAGSANNSACCFGKAAADANKSIINDYHSTVRPAAHGYDVGFMQTN